MYRFQGKNNGLCQQGVYNEVLKTDIGHKKGRLDRQIDLQSYKNVEEEVIQVERKAVKNFLKEVAFELSQKGVLGGGRDSMFKDVGKVMVFHARASYPEQTELRRA